MEAARAVTLNWSPDVVIQVATSEARENIGIRTIDDARVTRMIRLPRTGLASTKRAHGDETAFPTRRETVGPWSHGLDHGLIASHQRGCFICEIGGCPEKKECMMRRFMIVNS